MNCEICEKAPKSSGIGRHLHSGKWRHRGPRTNRIVKPNLQKWNGYTICTQCMKTMAKATAR